MKPLNQGGEYWNPPVLHRNIPASCRRAVRVFVRVSGLDERGYSPGIGKDEILTHLMKNELGRRNMKATSLTQKYTNQQQARSQGFCQGVWAL